MYKKKVGDKPKNILGIFFDSQYLFYEVIHIFVLFFFFLMSHLCYF